MFESSSTTEQKKQTPMRYSFEEFPRQSNVIRFELVWKFVIIRYLLVIVANIRLEFCLHVDLSSAFYKNITVRVHDGFIVSADVSESPCIGIVKWLFFIDSNAFRRWHFNGIDSVWSRRNIDNISKTLYYSFSLQQIPNA